MTKPSTISPSSAVFRLSIPQSPLLVIPARRLRLRIIGSRFAPARLGCETDLFIPADPTVGVQTFQDEFGRGGTHGIRLARAQSKKLGLIEQALNARQLLDHLCRWSGLIQLQRSTQLEPLHDAGEVLAVENPRKYFAHREANQFARDGVAAFELAFVLQLELPGDRR